jgi:hypothetical protein
MVHGVKRLGYDYTNCSRALDLVRSRTGYFIYNSYLLIEMDNCLTVARLHSWALSEQQRVPLTKAFASTVDW